MRELPILFSGAMVRVIQRDVDSKTQPSRLLERCLCCPRGAIQSSRCLPAYRTRNKGRFVEVVNLLNILTRKGHYQFTGEVEAGEYLFESAGIRVPFPAPSTGYP